MKKLKKLKRNKIFLILIAIIIFYSNINAQYEKDINKDAPPLSKQYYRISSFESILTWSVASLNSEPYISELLIDSKNNLHIAYYDNTINSPVYVSGKDGNFKREILDKNRELGSLISIASNAHNINISYLKNNKIWYANNNSGAFNNYAMDLRNNRKIIDLKLVVSIFNSPILFFIDGKGVLSVSRFYRDNFFSDLVYTNKIIEKVYPVAENNGYAVYMKEYSTGNIFYASRKTNTAFTFFDNNPILNNVNQYTVDHESHNRFNIIYNTKDDMRQIKYKKFYDGSFTEGVIAEEEQNIISFDSTLDYASQSVVLYTKEDGNKYIYIDGQIIDLSILGKSVGEVRISAARYPEFYIAYYNTLFKELRISKLNISDIEK